MDTIKEKTKGGYYLMITEPVRLKLEDKKILECWRYFAGAIIGKAYSDLNHDKTMRGHSGVSKEDKESARKFLYGESKGIKEWRDTLLNLCKEDL